MIRCNGCKREFGSLLEYKQHKQTADHADAGEVFYRAGAEDRVSHSIRGP